MFGRFLPRETSFFDFFEQHTQLTVEGTKEFLSMVTTGAAPENDGSGSELPLLGFSFSQFPLLGLATETVDDQAPAGPVITSLCGAMVAALAPVW